MNCHVRSLSQRVGVIATIAVAITVMVSSQAVAQTGTLAEPFPQPPTNAALHYQRALIHLAKIDDSEIELLTKPIWEILPQGAASELSPDAVRLLARGRFAIGAATSGSRTLQCNFGIDFSQAGATSQLPHVDPMVRLGRLLALRGAQAEADGDWEEALIIYFDGLRMGRHLAHQQTLLEALAGIEILRSNYYALARWASRCPARLLVARAFGLLESIQSGLVEPPQIIAREASILVLEFDRLQESFPDGDWPRMILDSYGKTVSGDRPKDRASAIDECIQRGVPKEIFESDDAFGQYVGKLRATANRFVESVAACMALPPRARLQRAAALNRKYSVVIPILSSETLIDPVAIGALMSQHEAELSLTRIALAVAASKQKQKYPASLAEIATRFGGAIPVDPYSRKAVIYQPYDDGRAYSIEIPALGRLPRVTFQSRSPEPAK